MTVRELMAELSRMDPDMEVRVTDTYWESEGYYDKEVSDRQEWEDEHPLVTSPVVEEGCVLLF